MPALEELLRPAKWLDEQVLRQYTKVSERFNLDEGRKKYFVGKIFELEGLVACLSAHVRLGFSIDNGTYMFAFLIYVDDIYNWLGIAGAIEDDNISEPKVLNREVELFKAYNRSVRLPIFLTGLALSGNFGIDFFNYITEGKPIEQNSYYHLRYGLGLLSLASSMYIKDANPKLLKKVTLRERAYNWLGEKIQGLLQPLPEPAHIRAYSIRAYSTLEDNL